MSCRYDVLVLDLDGTLLDPVGRVSTANRQAVARARERGLRVIVATGRALVESMEPLAAIHHTGIVVTAGGSLLMEAATARTLHRSAMPLDLVEDVTHALLQNGHKVLLLKDAAATGYDYLAVGPADLDPASQWWFETMPVRVRFVHELADDPHPDDTVRAGAVACESELAPLASRLQEQIGDRGFLQHWGAVTETAAIGSTTHLLEVFNPNVNKWSSIERFCVREKIDASRVAAIGDGLNDVELVTEAGLGVAMENADSRVLAVADRVCADNASDGVALAIEHLLAGRW